MDEWMDRGQARVLYLSESSFHDLSDCLVDLTFNSFDPSAAGEAADGGFVYGSSMLVVTLRILEKRTIDAWKVICNLIMADDLLKAAGRLSLRILRCRLAPRLRKCCATFVVLTRVGV